MFINSRNLKQRILKDNQSVETLQMRKDAIDVSGLFEEDSSSIDTDNVVSCSKCGCNSNANGKSEKFQDVFNEMSKNVPDRTSTIQEKKLAISYIDRLLGCKDITKELKTYWQNKKEVIQQEIVRIKNEKKVGTGEKVNDVWKEFSDFAAKFRKGPDDSLSKEDRKEYLDTFNTTCITYYTRLLTCKDVTPNLISEYLKSIFEHISDMKKYKIV